MYSPIDEVKVCAQQAKDKELIDRATDIRFRAEIHEKAESAKKPESRSSEKGEFGQPLDPSPRHFDELLPAPPDLRRQDPALDDCSRR